MTGPSRTPPKGAKRTSETERREKLGSALRDNLARRKAQSRSRAVAGDEPAPSEDPKS